MDNLNTLVQQGGNPARLLTAISAIDGRQYTVESARLFAAALAPMSLRDALDAFAAWQKMPHAYSRIQPYDINEIVKKKREKKIPSEKQLADEIAKVGENFSTTEYLTFIKLRISGKSLQETLRQISQIPKQIEYRKPKKRVNNRQIARQMQQAGTLQIGEIIGKTAS